jgi:hypothetical protein
MLFAVKHLPHMDHRPADPRTYFVTGTKGFFDGLLPSLACPNQWSNNGSSRVTLIDLPFTVGCNVKGVRACTGAVLQQQCWQSNCTRCAPTMSCQCSMQRALAQADTLLRGRSCKFPAPMWFTLTTASLRSINPCFLPCLPARAGLSVWGIASVLKRDMMFPFSKFQFLNITLW